MNHKRNHLKRSHSHLFDGMLLPLTAGLQVIPIPFIMDGGASEFIYQCSAAVQALKDIGIIKGALNMDMNISSLEVYLFLGT